jgi:malonyl-CoA decarboxylase
MADSEPKQESDMPKDTPNPDVEERPSARGFLDRTISNLRQAWTGLSGQTRTLFGAAPRPDLPDEDLEAVVARMEACAEATPDEVAVRARAADLGRTYLTLDEIGRQRFIATLAERFDVDREAVDTAMEAASGAGDDKARRIAETRLREALEPRWRRLLTRFTSLPEGVKFLVDLRAEMLPQARENPAVAELSADLRQMLAAWFDVGLLELRRITWDSPAALLEKLIAYEAVHEIRSWDDLKNRLEIDRRCFAYFHPNMPGEPLIFVEVALVEGMSDSVDALLDGSAPIANPDEADSAIFYSISNAQSGLVGISFGNFLIKRVVELLRTELPNLKTFATLSPIPGFARWLAVQADGDEPLLHASELMELRARLGDNDLDEASALKQLIANADWVDDAETAEVARGPLTRLAARYLLEARRGDGRARDPVAHFHLSNGARMQRLNWLGDRSMKGAQQSAGMMINYLYRLSDIEANGEAYSAEAKIASSSAMRGLVKT